MGFLYCRAREIQKPAGTRSGSTREAAGGSGSTSAPRCTAPWGAVSGSTTSSTTCRPPIQATGATGRGAVEAKQLLEARVRGDAGRGSARGRGRRRSWRAWRPPRQAEAMKIAQQRNQTVLRSLDKSRISQPSSGGPGGRGMQRQPCSHSEDPSNRGAWWSRVLLFDRDAQPVHCHNPMVDFSFKPENSRRIPLAERRAQAGALPNAERAEHMRHTLTP
jgi:hypothetical protein